MTVKGKGFALIPLLILFGIVVVGAFFASSKKLFWESHTSEIPGLSFKLPKTFVQKQSANGLTHYSDGQMDVVFEEVIEPDELSRLGTQEDMSTKWGEVAGKGVFLDSQMSAEGVFERQAYILLDSSARIIILTVSADTRVKGNEEPAIYERVEKFADQVLSTVLISDLEGTVDWKTYTNQKYSFTFKYPANWVEEDWRIEEKGVDSLNKKGVWMQIYEDVGDLDALGFLEMIFYKDYNDEGLEFLKETYMGEYRKGTYLTPITLNGKAATFIEQLTRPSGSAGSGVWVTFNGDGLLLVSYLSADFENQDKIFEKILSTFKFSE